MKKVYKLTSMLTIFILLVNMSMPVIANSITNETAETSEANVEFDAKINNDYNVVLDIDKGGTLNLSTKVSNTGYLKDVKVVFDGNNYEITTTEDKNIKGITGNILELNQINAGETVNLALPIKLTPTEKVQPEIFEKDSNITLEATYINANNKEEKISKVIKEHVKWSSENQSKISETLKRYIKYDANKTLVTFDVTDGIIDNKIPALSKTVIGAAPKLNGILPSKAIVIGNNISYKYENGVLAINKANEKDVDGKILWNSTDTYEVTYLYDTVSQGETITADIASTIINVNHKELTSKPDTTTFEVKEQVGNIVESTISGTDSINKGYMYSNLNLQDGKVETAYDLMYTINVGYADLLDEIDINESSDKNYSIDKKISISLDELKKVLGEDGTIKLLSKDGTQIAILNKDTLSADINNLESVNFITSKPVAEGNINIKVSKAIKADLALTKDEIKALDAINNNINVVGKISNNIVSTKDTTKKIALADPTSKATIDISNKNLSTISKNNDVVITATLETNDVTDALYKNPTLEITLPNEVTNIELTDAKLLYEDELLPANFTAEGNKIKLTLTGTQTKYSSQVTSTGSVVRIVANLTLDNLSPSRSENISLAYTNEATGENKTVVSNTNLIAPTGFVTTDALTVGTTTVTSQETTENLAKIRAFDSEKDAIITGTIVNNLGSDASGFEIVGRIPFKGNTTTDGNRTDLGSTFDTTMKTAITTTGLDEATIYYSTKADATNDLAAIENAWTTTFTNSAKSYMIVSKNNVANAAKVTFTYKTLIPKDLDYAQISKGTYSVYYNNNASTGNTQSAVTSAAVGVKTSAIPVIETTITATDYNTGKLINEKDQVVPGEYIKYTIVAKNTGKEKATGVSAKLSIESQRTDTDDEAMKNETGSGFVSYGYDLNEDLTEVSSINANATVALSDIEAGKSTSIDVIAYVSSTITENATYILRSAITAGNADAESDKSFSNVASTGVVNLKLVSSANGKGYNDGDTLSYKLYVTNESIVEKKNIVVTVAIPDGLSFKSGDNAEYNESKKTLTYKIDSLTMYSTKNYTFKFMANSTTIKDQDVSVYALATYDGAASQVQSNSINSTIGYVNGITSKLTSNIPEGDMLDTDSLEYYITVYNSSKFDVTVNLSDVIPTELQVSSYTIQNGSDGTTKNMTTSTVTTQQTLKSGSTMKLTIATKPYTLDTKTSTASIENQPILKVNNVDMQINSLKHTIKGTKDFNKADVSSDDINTTPDTYSISGVAWVDENGDGKKDDNEAKIPEISFTLFSKATKAIAVDSNGTEIKATSNADGKYTLKNIPSGDYVVVAQYDTITYAITKYQTNGLSSNENSDFIEATLDGSKVAATNIMSIGTSNLYNIDLGLNAGKRFDLELDKSITKVVVSSTSAAKQSTDYDNKKMVKCELVGKTINTDTVLVQYNIKVTNAGNVAGYAKSIADYIPNGMTFSSELNNDWYVSGDNVAYNTALANTIINPGETKEISLVLTRKMNGNNVGMVHNTAEIVKAYNESGLNDIDSTPDNKKDGEDDISSADIFIAIKTGARNLAITGISVGILALIGLAVYEIKKHIIK